MQIVIEISEEDYKLIKSYGKGSTNYRISLNLYDAVRDGTPLPKGHGDLIDRNDLLEYTDVGRCAYTPTINRYDIITAPTIIEGSESE